MKTLIVLLLKTHFLIVKSQQKRIELVTGPVSDQKLHCYVVTENGRTYTAILKLPPGLVTNASFSWQKIFICLTT